MTVHRLVLTVLALLWLAVACQNEPDPEPTETDGVAEIPETPPPATAERPATDSSDLTTEPAETAGEDQIDLGSIQGGVLVSELLPGVPGGNLTEFIELYNASLEAADLAGWSLWYLAREGQEPQEIYAWKAGDQIPPLGHYLLVHEDQDVGLEPDAIFSTSLSERQGGLIVRDAAGATVDLFGWGAAPEGYFAGQPSKAPGGGASLERAPGGADGNWTDSQDNAADLADNPQPHPQNSGSPITPLPENLLTIELALPKVVEPGAEFTYQISVTNEGLGDAQNVIANLPVADHFSVVAVPDGTIGEEGRLEIDFGTLGSGDGAEATVTLASPLTYIDTLVSGYYAAADDYVAAYGPPQSIAMAGGSIPVATARDLIGDLVTVEGVATMYTGGFFAGSSGTKFYLEDESGGIQVYIPGGMDVINIDVGDRVQVTGEIELYRDSIELIPVDMLADIQILSSQTESPQAALITIGDNENETSIIGRLNTVEGTASRVEEFTYSYEMDLIDDDGNTTLVYIEKDTGVTAEPMEVGNRYQVTGISEFYSTRKQIKPRYQDDIVQVYPPILRLAIDAANSAEPGQLITYTIEAFNHTPDAMTNLVITAKPGVGATLESVSAGGERDDTGIAWTFDTLAGDGVGVAVSYTVRIVEEAFEPLVATPVTATADQWPDPATTPEFLTFVTGIVPIWAIQGSGPRSPYVLKSAVTEGIVTAEFPELGGFWIQGQEPAEGPANSNGLFIFVGEDVSAPVEPGDLVRLEGRVRELSNQTALDVDLTAIEILSSGNPLPAAAVYLPAVDPAEALAYNEALEGMLVTLDRPAVAIAPTTKYGETVLVYEDLAIDSLRREEDKGMAIFIDDGSSFTHEDLSTFDYALGRGDSLSGITGPLAYTFGNYKIEPITRPEIVSTEQPLPSLPAAGPGEFSAATFNVENFFDRFDPHPSDTPRPGNTSYQTKVDKLAAAIDGMGAPTFIGLQEVENIDVLYDLVEHDLLSGYSYEPYLIEGPDARGIDVAFLARSDQAEVLGVGSYPEPTGLTSRPPLVMTATVVLGDEAQTVYLLNNHFSSLASGEAETEPRRAGQAAWNVTLMDRLREGDPDAQFIMMGDLNSFWQTVPLELLEESGLVHIYNFFEDPADRPYTYIFQGGTQTLDHILVSPGLFDSVSLVEALHINADYALPAPDDLSARRVSDHDPLVVIFSPGE